MRGRMVSAAIASVIVGSTLSACASSVPDPAMVSTVASLASSGSSAQLALTLDESGRMLPGTLTTLLSDMAEEVSTSISSLELMQTSTVVDARYRSDALDAGRSELEALHLAQEGDTAAALDMLEAGLDALSELEAPK